MTTSKRKATKVPADVLARADQLRTAAIKHLEKFRAYTNENLAPSRFRRRNWSTPNVKERDMPRFDREALLAASRQYVETFPIVAALLTNMQDSIVGNGFRLVMQSADEKWNKEVEDWHFLRRDKLDIRQIRTWGQLQRAWWARRWVDGDVGIYKQAIPHAKAPTERFLNTIEAERIRKEKYSWLDQGVDYDENGRPLTFWVGPRPENQMDWTKIIKQGTPISAEQFILYANFTGDRVDSLRGTSALQQNMNLLRDIAEILEAVVQKIKNEAFIALVFMTEASYDGKLFGDQESVKTGEDGVKRRHARMVPGMNFNLAPGEKLDLLGLKTPNNELMPFLRFLLRIAGAVYGWPLEMSLLDVSETNFSGGRLLMELAKRRVRVEQDGLAAVSSDCFMWDLAGAIKDKELTPPKSMAKPHQYGQHRWGKPSMPYYDPAREAQAAGMMLDRYLTTPQAILADSSDMDMEDVLDGWATFTKECAARKLPIIRGNVSTTLNDAGEQTDGAYKDKPAGENNALRK